MAKQTETMRIEASADLMREVIIALAEQLLDGAIRPDPANSSCATSVSLAALAADLHHLAYARAILQRRRSALARMI